MVIQFPQNPNVVGKNLFFARKTQLPALENEQFHSKFLSKTALQIVAPALASIAPNPFVFSSVLSLFHPSSFVRRSSPSSPKENLIRGKNLVSPHKAHFPASENPGFRPFSVKTPPSSAPRRPLCDTGTIPMLFAVTKLASEVTQ
jgi:hypothetical protein